MRASAVACVIVLTTGVAASSVCGQSGPRFSKEELESELKAVDADIATAEAESARYTGGLVKSLVDLRAATLKQTRAMLAQRANAVGFGITLRHTIDGKPFVLPATALQELTAIDGEIATLEKQVAVQQAEADRYSGGLVQAMSLATVATSRQSLAMLQQKRLAIRYSLPQYIGFANLASASGAAAAPPTAATASPVPADVDKEWEIVEIDARVTERNATWWKYAWKLTLKNSAARTIVLVGQIEFQDKDGFIVDDDSTDRMLLPAGATETFTGYALVTTGVATNIVRTGVKVRRAQ